MGWFSPGWSVPVGGRGGPSHTLFPQLVPASRSVGRGIHVDPPPTLWLMRKGLDPCACAILLRFSQTEYESSLKYRVLCSHWWLETLMMSTVEENTCLLLEIQLFNERLMHIEYVKTDWQRLLWEVGLCNICFFNALLSRPPSYVANSSLHYSCLAFALLWIFHVVFKNFTNYVSFKSFSPRWLFF